MATVPTYTLDTILESLSRDVWERLRDIKALSPKYNVRFGEETITDLLMLDLNRHVLTQGLFVQTSKDREAIRGTDFEWWLGSDVTGWIRLAVQAKKLDLKSNRYNKLNHTINNVKQIDRLERYANRHGAIPLYCLYNYNDNVNPYEHWHCCQRPFDEEAFGCTLTPSSNIQNSYKYTW